MGAQQEGKAAACADGPFCNGSAAVFLFGRTGGNGAGLRYFHGGNAVWRMYAAHTGKKVEEKGLKGKMKIRGILFCLIVSTCFFTMDMEARAAEMPDASNEGAGAGVQEEGTAQGESVTGVPLESTTLMYAVEKVNVRKGPGTDTEVMGELTQGEMVFAVELLAEGWYRIVFGGKTGYVRQDFLTLYGTAGAWEAPEQPSVPVISGQDSAATRKRTAREEDTPGDGGQDETLPRAAKPAKGKSKNTSAIVIIAAAVLLILGYGVFQVVKEKRENEKKNDEGDTRLEESEDEAWDAEERIDEWADEDAGETEALEEDEMVILDIDEV